MSDKKIAVSTIYQIFTKLTTSASGFIITILLARFYGAQGYGQFTKITAFIALFYIIVDFGLNAIFLQFQEKEARFNLLLGLRLFLSIIIVIIVNLIILILPFNSSQDIGFSPLLHLSAFIFSLTIICQAVLFSSAAIFQKKLRYDLQTYSFITGTLITLILIFIFSKQQLPLEYILLAYLLGNAVSAIYSLILIKEKITPLALDKKFAVKILKDSSPLGLMLFFNLIYFRVDIIILSLYKSTTDVALYGYAYKYFEFLLAIPLFLSNAVYPFLLGSLKNLRSYYALSHKYILIFLLFSLVIIIPAWFCAPIIAIVKKDFIPSILIFRILLLSLPVFFLTSILQWILIAKNKKAFLLKAYLIAALLNLLLNLIFIPKYGYTAAAIITAISELLILILLLFFAFFFFRLLFFFFAAFLHFSRFSLPPSSK